ncbi:MAG TPA: nuclear transport factor 2 family protein, partial [Haliangium sp.]|nr:nuclear transport factor 2 family protein [Haliangium sp.]
MHRAPAIAGALRRRVALASGLVVLAGALAAGCRSSRPASVPSQAFAASERVSVVELRRELEATVLENYLQLGLGNMEAYADSIDTGDDVTSIGIGPDDVFAGAPDDDACTDAVATTPEAMALQRRGCGRAAERLPFRSGEPCLQGSETETACIGVLSKNLGVRMSRDGTTAWVVDEISYRIPHRGRQAAMPLRYTAVFARDIERWVLVMEHLSYPLSSDLVRELAAAGALAAPAALEKHGVPSLWQIVHEYIAVDTASRARSPVLAATRTASEDRVILLPDPRAEMRGAAIYSAPNLADVFGPGTEVSARDLRVFFAPGGRVAWMAGNLAMT